MMKHAWWSKVNNIVVIVHREWYEVEKTKLLEKVTEETNIRE